MVLIGICGKLGSGKNYITTNVIIPLLEKFKKNYLELSFADQIKINVMTKKGISYNDLYINKTQESRQLLQVEGTKEREFNSNIWIDYIQNWITVFKCKGISNFVITDCRYINECNFIKNNGGIIIKVVAPNRNEKRLVQEASSSGTFSKENYLKIKNHSSECDTDKLPDTDFDYIIENDGDLDLEVISNDLYKKMNKL